MKTYSGALARGQREVFVSDAEVVKRLRCLDYFTPSFAWGFRGAAPDELAIAILHDHFNTRGRAVGHRVTLLYRAFVEDVVRKFGHDRPWSVGDDAVGRWVHDNETPSSGELPA